MAAKFQTPDHLLPRAVDFADHSYRDLIRLEVSTLQILEWNLFLNDGLDSQQVLAELLPAATIDYFTNWASCDPGPLIRDVSFPRLNSSKQLEGLNDMSALEAQRTSQQLVKLPGL